MAKTFTLDQIGRQIELLTSRLESQHLQLSGKQKPASLDDFVALQKRCDEYDKQLRHLRSAYHQAVDEPLRGVGNQLMIDLMMTASQDELLELQRILKKLNGVSDDNHGDENNQNYDNVSDNQNGNQSQVQRPF